MQFFPVAHDIMQCINYFIAMLRGHDYVLTVGTGIIFDFIFICRLGSRDVLYCSTQSPLYQLRVSESAICIAPWDCSSIFTGCFTDNASKSAAAVYCSCDGVWSCMAFI